MKLRLRIPGLHITSLTILISLMLFVAGCASATASHDSLITNLTANKSIVLPSQQCNITCVASGLDDTILTYQWDSNRGSISGEGSTATWIAPDTVGIYTITVAVSDGNGSQSTSYLSIEVISNSAPTIENLTSDQTKLVISESCNIECIASDNDNDELHYKWSISGGSISGAGSTITWSSPDLIGIYTITVVITDGHGGKVTDSLDIEVLKVNNSPSIGEFITTSRIGVLRDNGKVLKDKYYYIECIASDPDDDELTYDWWVSDGKIASKYEAILPETPLHYIPKIEAGSMILWHAPDYQTKAIIEVIVSDERGDEADEDFPLKVVLTTCQLYS